MALLGTEMMDLSDRIKALYSVMWLPIISAIVGASLLLGVWIGTSFILADGDEQKIRKAKEKLKYCIIGFVVMFMVGALLPLFVAALQGWLAEG